MKTNLRVLSLLTVMFFLMNLSAQSFLDKKISVGIDIVKNEYVGDLGSGLFDLKNNRIAVGVDVNMCLNKFISVGLGASYGQYGYMVPAENKRLNNSGGPLYNFNEKFMGLKLDMNALAYFKFNNGLMLPENSKLEPFVAAGVGFAKFIEIPSLKATGVPPTQYPLIITDGIDLIIPAGIGLAWHMSDKLALKYTFLYNFTFSENADNRDKTLGVLYVFPRVNTTNDNFAKQMIGLSYKF